MKLASLSCRYLLFAVTILFFSAFTWFKAAPFETAEPDLHNIRKLLMAALDSKITTDSLYTSLVAMKNRSPIINGYIGALEALKAKHAWNPYYKIKYLNDAEDTFKKAVAVDSHNIEIRFMRFSIEDHVPGFLGFDKNLLADRQEMIKQIDKKNYTSADQHLVKVIVLFLIDSKRCTPAEQKNLHQQLAAL